TFSRRHVARTDAPRRSDVLRNHGGHRDPTDDAGVRLRAHLGGPDPNLCARPHVRADPEVGAPSDKQEGEWATVRLLLPPFWLCAPPHVGASGGWNHRRGPQRRSRRALPGRVECPPCASTYSPGTPQSSARRQYREASEQLVVVLAPVARMKAEDLEQGFC